MTRNVGEVPMKRMYPEPKRPIRADWSIVIAPLITTAAKTAQVR